MAAESLRMVTREDADKLTAFIRDTVINAHAKGAVVGISGGVDSAVVAKLCVDALGGKNVYCIFMPAAITPPEDYIQTKNMCQEWNVRYSTVSIQPAVDAFSEMLLTIGRETSLEKGNIMARCRMIVLFDRAKKNDALVFGTINRSELLMGYMTKFGDGAEDAMPLYGIYKTQVWQLAKIIGVPWGIIGKAPTAGLWEGQTDEKEMGITYHDLDMALSIMEGGGDDTAMASAANITLEKAAEIRAQVARMKHKSAPAIVPE